MSSIMESKESSQELQKEFEKAYDMWAEPIFRHCFFKLHNKELAKEISQDAFMRTWDYLRKGEKVDNLKAFLYKVANNLVVNEIKRKKQDHSLDKMNEETGFEPEDENYDSPLRSAEGKEALIILHGLDMNYKEALIMRYVDDLTVKEIAKILGESESNISVRIHRGLKKLKEKYER